MATKRRKMWAVVDDEGQGSQVFTSLKSAKRWADHEPRDGTGWHVVPYIERLPGDVVLSRETRQKIEADLVNAHEAWLRGDDASTKASIDAALALLRGRR